MRAWIGDNRCVCPTGSHFLSTAALTEIVPSIVSSMADFPSSEKSTKSRASTQDGRREHCRAKVTETGFEQFQQRSDVLITVMWNWRIQRPSAPTPTTATSTDTPGEYPPVSLVLPYSSFYSQARSTFRVLYPSSCASTSLLLQCHLPSDRGQQQNRSFLDPA